MSADAEPFGWGELPGAMELGNACADDAGTERVVFALLATIDRDREQLRSCFMWARNARGKGTGLTPATALRWIDELGRRVMRDA